MRLLASGLPDKRINLKQGTPTLKSIHVLKITRKCGALLRGWRSRASGATHPKIPPFHRLEGRASVMNRPSPRIQGDCP